jgi:beta-xylosidase
LRHCIQLESTIKPADTLSWSTPGEQTECWATDGAYRNGKYYFYLSVGAASVGVLESDSPTGPWKDPIGKPLLSDSQGKALKPQTTFRDPAVFEDDDGGLD